MVDEVWGWLPVQPCEISVAYQQQFSIHVEAVVFTDGGGINSPPQPPPPAPGTLQRVISPDHLTYSDIFLATYTWAVNF